MANVDTGLGWSAAANYLRNPATLLGTIAQGGAIWKDDIPVVSSSQVAAVVAGGFLAATDNNANPLYLAVQNNKVDVSGAAFVGYVADNYIHLMAVWKQKITGSTSFYAAYPGARVPYAMLGTPTHDTATDLYYMDWRASTFQSGTITRGTVYTSRADALTALLGAQQDYYKLNPGYAVCCIAKWIDLAGETAVSPVLISSDPDYAALSTDGQNPATYTSFGARWQNRSFTCTLVPGYDSMVTSLVPVADFTAAFPRPISAATLFEAVARVSNLTVLTTPDPYGDDAEPGGGEGNPDDEEDIDFSATPSVGTSLGFFRMWNPTEAELRSLASWMWSSAFDLDTFKRIFSAPIDAILGLSLVPVQPSTIGGFNIVLGGIDTEISAFTVTNRYVTLDCGSLSVDERWGAYLDYSPYTKMSIFLPYIGFRDISTDDVMDKTVALQYNVDVLSGACVAELKCGGTVLYSWQGNCAQQLPITSQDWSSALSAALGLAGSAAAAIVSGGSSLPLAGTVASATVNALSLKPRMERGGSISGAAGAMAGQVPYLVRERPEQAVPGRQNHFIGYPSFTTVTLGSIAGYTEVESIHLEGIPATAAELDELENILKEGFIL